MAVLRRSMLFFAPRFSRSRASSPAPQARPARNWAAPQIRAVTKAGVLGTSPTTFAPQAPLTQAALADAIRDDRRAPASAAAGAAAAAVRSRSSRRSAPARPSAAPCRSRSRRRTTTVARVDFAVDGTEVGTALDAPYVLDLDTTHARGRAAPAGRQRRLRRRRLRDRRLADHRGECARARVTTAPTAPVALPIAKSSLPAAPAAPAQPQRAQHALYHAVFPTAPGVGEAARRRARRLPRARRRRARDPGRRCSARGSSRRRTRAPRRSRGCSTCGSTIPPARTTSSSCPIRPATRAEAAYSFAQLLQLDGSALGERPAGRRRVLPA